MPKVISIEKIRSEAIRNENIETSRRVLRNLMRSLLHELHRLAHIDEKRLSKKNNLKRKKQVAALITAVVSIFIPNLTIRIFDAHYCERCKRIVMDEVYRKFHTQQVKTAGDFLEVVKDSLAKGFGVFGK